MTIEEILDYALPIKKTDLSCKNRLAAKEYRREKLRKMIEAYKNGEIVSFEPLKLKVDLTPILQKLNN